MSSVRPATSAFPARAAPSTPSTSNFLRPRTLAPSPLNNRWAALCKVVLVRRLRHMFIISAFVAYSALLCVVFDPKELPGSLFNAFRVLLFAPITFLGALSIFILRKQTLTTSPYIPSSNLTHYLSLTKSTNLPVLFAYLLGSIPILASYVWCTAALSTHPNLSWFVYEESRDAYSLNERRVYITLLHAFVAVCAAAQHVLQGRSVVGFDDDSTMPIPMRLKAKALMRMTSAARAVAYSNGAFWILYLSLRRQVLRFLLLYITGGWARPYFYSFAQHNISFSPTLIIRGLASTTLTIVLWETAHICFDVYTTQPMKISQFASNPNQCLLSGLREPDAYYRHFVYLELSTLSLTNPARRRAIFTDIKADSSKGGNWSEVSRECLKLLGGELQRAKKRGNVVPSAGAPASTPTTPASSTSNSTSPSKSFGTPSRVLHEPIFRPSPKTFLDNLSASLSSPTKNPIPTPVIAATTALATNLSTHITTRVPAIFQTQMLGGGGEAQAGKVEIVVIPDNLKPVGWEARVADYVPERFRGKQYWKVFGKRPSFVVGRCLVRQREVIWTVQALANLLCASLTEDPYGVAQGDIPKILEAFILYLMALEDLSKSLLVGLEGDAKLDMERELEKQVGVVEEALKDGVRVILSTFQPFMKELSFAPRIATRLQLLVDWG